MVVAPGLPVGLGPPQIGLHLQDPRVLLHLVLQPRSLWRQGLDLGLIDDVFSQALAGKWTVGFVFFRATALLLAHRRLAFANDLRVVAGDDVAQVGHRPVGHLDRLPVENLVTRMAGGEALVQDLKELFADVGGDRAAERGVEPADVSLPSPPSPRPLLLGSNFSSSL